MKLLRSIFVLLVIVALGWTLKNWVFNGNDNGEPAAEQTREGFQMPWFGEPDEGDCVGSACNRDMPQMAENYLGCDVFIHGLRVYSGPRTIFNEVCPDFTRAELDEFSRQWVELNGIGQ